MTEKYKFGEVKVNGQAMFGDYNQMQVNISELTASKLNVKRDEDRLKELLISLQKKVEESPEDGEKSISKYDKSDIAEVIKKVISELKKEENSQQVGLLQHCMNKVISAVKNLPPILKIAVDIKGLLGL